MSDATSTIGGPLQEIGDLVRRIFQAEQRLRELGVISSNRSLDSLYGEWIVAQVEGGQLAQSASQRDWDVRVGDVRIQVKTDRKAPNNKQRGAFGIWMSTVDRLDDRDFVVCVQLRPDRSVEAYHKVPVRDIRSWPTKRTEQGEWYEIWRRLRGGQYLQPCAPFDEPVTSEGQSGGLAGDLNGAMGEVPAEDDEPGVEERRQIIQAALDREDLWGSEEDTYWDQLVDLKQETSSSSAPPAPSIPKQDR